MKVDGERPPTDIKEQGRICNQPSSALSPSCLILYHTHTEFQIGFAKISQIRIGQCVSDGRCAKARHVKAQPLNDVRNEGITVANALNNPPFHVRLDGELFFAA